MRTSPRAFPVRGGGEVGASACCRLATGGCSGMPRSGFPAGEQDREGERKKNLLRLFGSWRHPIGPLIEATDEGAILRNDLFNRRPVRNLGSGRVTLLGDAAHPPTPNLGQGACQALEDALVLAGCFSGQREPVAADAAPTRHAARSAAPPSSSSPLCSAGSGSGSSHCSARYGMGSPRSPSRRCSPDCLSHM
jgi:2-polyprenyl-6-methoxyphenol hydroxylase-like FAD-dependent oxidoreductase